MGTGVEIQLTDAWNATLKSFSSRSKRKEKVVRRIWQEREMKKEQLDSTRDVSPQQ